MAEQAQIADIAGNLFWTYLIHSTVFLGLCAATIYIAKPKSYGLVEWLWKAAATLPIATSMLAIVLSMNSLQFGYLIAKNSVVDSTSLGRTGTTEATIQTFESITPASEEFENGISILSSEGNSQHPVALKYPPAAPRRERPDTIEIVPSISLSMAVCIVIAASLSWSVLKYLQFANSYRKLVMSSNECRGGVVRCELDRFLSSVSIARPVRLLMSDEAKQPFAVGIRRWTIVVPRDIEVSLDKQQLRALFAHEIGHFVRSDNVWMMIGTFTCTFLAFQPLNFIARRKWLDASEFLADTWAVQSGVSPLNLVRCLARVAEWQSVGIQPAMKFANSDQHLLTRRAEHLLSDAVKRDVWRGNAIRLSATAALVIVSLLFMLIGPHVGDVHARDAETSERRVRTGLQNQLEEIVHQLRDVTRNLDELDLSSRIENDVEGLTERLGQLKQRSALLAQRATLLTEVCEKDLP